MKKLIALTLTLALLCLCLPAGALSLGDLFGRGKATDAVRMPNLDALGEGKEHGVQTVTNEDFSYTGRLVVYSYVSYGALYAAMNTLYDAMREYGFTAEDVSTDGFLSIRFEKDGAWVVALGEESSNCCGLVYQEGVTFQADASGGSMNGGSSSSSSGSSGTMDRWDRETANGLCHYCHGSGVCPACNGRRGLSVPTYGQGGVDWVDCAGCEGTGRCWKCHGTGKAN